MIIPNKVKTYKPFGNGKRYTEFKRFKKLVYYPKPDEEIDVLYWQQYPSYDFIFGVPTKKNRLFRIEVGFFQWRDVRKKKVSYGFYVDKTELEQMAKGFNLMLKESTKNAA